MDMRDLQVFVELAQLRHFGKTAASVNLSQPSVSRLLKRLEEELGVELLERGTRRVELTPSGVEFLAHARTILAACERGIREARRAADKGSPKVTLGVSTSATLFVLDDALLEIRESQPETELHVCHVRDGAQVEALSTGACELLITSTPSPNETLASRLLGREPLVSVMRHDHPLAARETIELGEFYRERYVDCVDRDSLLGRVIAANMKACGVGQAGGQIVHAGDFLAMLALVAAGYGISAIPASLERVCLDGLVVRALVAPPIEVETHVWWAKSLRSEPARQVLACLIGDRGTAADPRTIGRSSQPSD